MKILMGAAIALPLALLMSTYAQYDRSNVLY